MASRTFTPAALLLALAVAGYSGAAWYTGKRVEASAGEQTKTLRKLLPFAAIDTLAYDRGIFSSDETLLVTFASSSSGEPLGLTVKSRIRHLPFTGLITGTVVSIDSKISTKTGAAASPVDIRTTLRYNGDGETVIAIPDLETPQFSSNRALFKIGFTQNLASYSIQGDVKKLSVTGRSGVQTRLSDLHIEGSQQRIFPDGPALYSGTSRLVLGSFEIGAPASPMTVLSIKQMTGDQSANFDKSSGLIGVSQKIGMQSVVFAGRDWGPAEFDLSLDRIDARSLAALNQAFQSAEDRMDARASNPSDWLMASGPQFQELLKHNPELRIDRFSFTRPDGESSLSALFRFEDVRQADLPSPLALLGKLHVTADVKSPENDLAALVPRQASAAGQPGGDWLGNMLDTGYFVRRDGYISSHIEYRGGNVWLNGKRYQRPAATLDADAYRPAPPAAVSMPRIVPQPSHPVPGVSVPAVSMPNRTNRTWGISRCIDRQGRTTFTDGPCPASSSR